MTAEARRRTAQLICKHLSSREPAVEVTLEDLQKKRRVPSRKQLGWGPDHVIRRGADIYLIHILSRPELPKWIRASALGKYPRTQLVVVALKTLDFEARRLAEEVCERCSRSGFALLCESNFGLVTILPPRRMTSAKCAKKGTELGHVPRWILKRLVASRGFSSHLQSLFSGFYQKYSKLKIKASRSLYNSEAEILEEFLRRFRRASGSFYLPIDRFIELKVWERQGSHGAARDHYFHTFNNLLLGFLILGEKFSDRQTTEVPDSFISSDPLVGKLKPWEVLWFLTCLNHDPGYIGEKFWPAVYSKFGLIRGSGIKRSIPPDVAQELRNGWETDLREARQDLLDLYQRFGNTWLPPQVATKIKDPFDAALQKAYFDGEQSSHSLLSGLTLIQGFTQDKIERMRQQNDYNRCLAACEIAALSMLFHDQRCRELLEGRGVPPISFERLPYASLMIFVDALQDDRRDITIDSWAKHGVLNGLQILSNGSVVRADVCLREIQKKYWPGKLLEYDSALRWLNSSSEVTFEIKVHPDPTF